MGITGYSLVESKYLIDYIIKEMKNIDTKEVFKNDITFITKHIDELLLYIKDLEKELGILAVNLSIDEDIIRKCLYENHLIYGCKEHNEIELSIGEVLGNKYLEIKKEVRKVANGVVKASSIVENVNSRIRKYINIKRQLPSKFLQLLKLFFNIKTYRRSRVEERKDKSPLELLTGKEYKNILEILSY